MITFKAKDASGEIINSALSPFTFPAGEAHTKKSEDQEIQPIEIAILQFTPESMSQDIMHYLMWADYIARHNLNLSYTEQETKMVLVLPYAPGARADRGTPYGAGIYSFLMNITGIHQILVFDPHSPTVVEELNAGWNKNTNVTVVSSQALFAQPYLNHFLEPYAGIIAPDKGAALRAKSVADLKGLPVYTVNKTRDFETGKLLGFDTSAIPKEGKFLIVDDICDGGGTFIGIAKASGIPMERLALYVSHGVFSGKALKTLPEYFRYIYTTNSFNPRLQLNGELVEQAWYDNSGGGGYDDDLYYRAHTTFTRFDVIRLLLDRIDQPVYIGIKTNN